MASSYQWVMVAAGAVLGCVAIGCLFALPVFIVPISADTGWSRTGISAAMTIAFIAMAFSGVVWGRLSDQFGPRNVVLAGAVMMVAGLFLLGRVQSLLQFQIVFGVVMGLSVSAFFIPTISAVTGWFDTQVSLAVSLVSVGIGIAPVTMSPLAAWLVSVYDWRTAYSILAVIALLVLLPVTFLLRRPPALAQAYAPAAGAVPQHGGMSLKEAMLSLPFMALAGANFFCCATHSGPIFHTVSYAISCGIPAMTAVTIYSVEGIAGMGGRVAFGLLGDRFGAKNVLALGLLAQAIGALGYYFANNLAAFYSAAAVFGFIYAGVMPLYAVLARQNFPLRMMGTIIGGTSLAGGLGMATGPVLGGWLFDTTGDYGWLYIACFGMGLGAFFVALLFRPFPKPDAGLAAA